MMWWWWRWTRKQINLSSPDKVLCVCTLVYARVYTFIWQSLEQKSHLIIIFYLGEILIFFLNSIKSRGCKFLYYNIYLLYVPFMYKTRVSQIYFIKQNLFARNQNNNKKKNIGTQIGKKVIDTGKYKQRAMVVVCMRRNTILVP